MKTQMNNKSGFTLIEIIVVMIIIGVLAAIALPNLFQNVQKSRASAAIAAMDGVKTGVEQWCVLNSNTPPTTALVLTPAGLPGAAVGNNFGYQISSTAGSIAKGSLTYTITATDIGGNTVALARAANGTFTCTPSAQYVGAC
ncbi:MAG: pilin [Candidatus Omnitrophica bacterium]|nr:pilin [Candidatus Omnitrophota bacterium]